MAFKVHNQREASRGVVVTERDAGAELHECFATSGLPAAAASASDNRDHDHVWFLDIPQRKHHATLSSQQCITSHMAA
jgi:hypothetical protein